MFLYSDNASISGNLRGVCVVVTLCDSETTTQTPRKLSDWIDLCTPGMGMN
jgi:hypothetical protein